MPIIITIILFGLFAYYLYQKRPTFAGKKVDYSFGDANLQKIKSKLEEREYTSAEFLIHQLDADELRQAIDHVTLNGIGKTILDWKETLPDSQLADLFLGVYYIHQASLNRGDLPLDALSPKQAELFFEYSDEAKDLLEKIDSGHEFKAEAYAQLLRVAGTTGDFESADFYFDQCLALSPNHLWAHIEYAENIQPKWGGNLEGIEKFINGLTDDPLVNQTVYLKMVWDSVLANENLFGGTMEDLKQQAKALLFEIDAEVNNHPPASIQKYVLYNYMTVVSEEFGIRALNQKYNKMMGENFTLYPFGIMH
jgi:tetratricopeptide (TPR) repeat protein